MAGALVVDQITSSNLTVSGTITTGSSSTPHYPLVLSSSQNASGTAVTFTDISPWAKRITVMFNGVSTTGTSHLLCQLGTGTFVTSGYNSSGAGCINAASPAVSVSTAGFIVLNDTATDVKNGHLIITLAGNNVYISSHTLGGDSTRDVVWWGAGSINLGGVVDRLRITTVNGTDTFDAGSFNIMWE